MHTEKKSKPMQIGASMMLGWALLGMPAVWSTAYAQGLPNEIPTSIQINAATSGGKGFATDDEATSNTQMNMRAARILRGKFDDTAVRGPRLGADATPLRSPSLAVDPDEAQRAAAAGAKLEQKTTTDIVSGAQRGSDIGVANYEKMDLTNKTLSTGRAEPGVNQTSGNHVNITETMPGFNETDMQSLQAMGNELYNDPSKVKAAAEKNNRNLRRDGCRTTEFVMLKRQDITSASSSPEHRILKVEFFDLVKQPIAGTNPVEYQTITQPSTFKRGSVNLSVATLGAASSVWWDRVDDDHAIRYSYSPYSSPKERNFFTYKHEIGIANGGAIQRVVNNGIANYGSAKDGWKLATGYSVPYGVTAAYVSSDLYRTDVNFTKATPGVPCNPDPPVICEVPSRGGDNIRWCPTAPGANIALMYDDQLNPNDSNYGKGFNDTLLANATSKDYSNDSAIKSGVITGLNATSSSKAKSLVGTCRRDSVASVQINVGSPYDVPDINICSDVLINPYPNGCQYMDRSFGLAYVGEHNFATVRAFSKKKIPIMDPVTNKQVKDAKGNLLFTYVKQPANVSGPIRTDFTVMGPPTCGGGSCSTENLPDDPLGGSEGDYLEYTHTPAGGDPKTFAFDDIYLQGGGSASFTHYGVPADKWLPVGSASGNGTLHEIRLMAKTYTVPINAFVGCEKYIEFAADNFCKGAKLTCVDSAPTRTVGGVTFGPGLPNSGIVDILKNWGTDSSAVFPDYDNGGVDDPTPTGPEMILLGDKMCWKATADPFTSCTTVTNNGTLKEFFKGDEIWATDCHLTLDDKGVPLDQSTDCKRDPKLDSCDSRFEGLYSGVCYNPSVAYDCGITVDSKVPVIVDEYADSCSGAMRCMGTECHRPNLSGGKGGEFAQAVSSMSALNFMINEMICAETGKAPENVTDPCTPIVFGGKPMYCKIPIGNQIGLTPHCCKEAKKGASSAPGWMDYLMAANALNNITRNATFMKFMSNYDAYNSTAKMFGDIAQPVTDLYASASSFVTENVIQPFTAGFDSLFSSFGSGSAAAATPSVIGVDSLDKASSIPGLSGIVNQLTQMLMVGINDLLIQMGLGDLAAMIFTTGAAGELVLTEAVQSLVLVFQVYSILKLIGHIIFACKPEEFEWGMNDKWRLCTFVDTCCSKKFLGVCLEKRQLYCCYKSIVTRVLAEQIIQKKLVNRAHGYRTSVSGGKLNKCNINCGGFTPLELASLDWSKVDLAEWTDSLVQSGLFNSADPASNYGISGSNLKTTMAISRNEDVDVDYDQRIAAEKTIEGWEQNKANLSEFAGALKSDADASCYVDDKKMPFTYPGCKPQVP